MPNLPTVRVRRISDLVTKGTTPTSIGHGFVGRGINFIKVETITADGQFIPGKEAHIDTATHAVLRRSQLVAGDILFSIAGALGRTTVVEDSWLPANTNQAFAIVRPSSRNIEIDSRYLLWQLRSPAIFKTISEINVQAAQANLSLEQVRDFEIPVVPVHEQHEIAEALDDVSRLIATLERLITKKQAIKQGMMQQFLGQAAGSAVRLADVTGRIGSGLTPRGGSAVYKTSGRPFVRSQNIGWGNLRLDDLAYIDEATHKSFPASEIRTGDVLLNITGASIGRSAVATPELDGGNVNQHVCEVRLNTQLMDPRWVNAVLNSRVGQDQIDAFQAGGNRQGLNFQQVGSIRVPAPEISQQRANGLTLGDIDTLIAALRRRLRKAHSVKQGMMQQLLTGRTRLPVPEAET